jgi:hypothetical protein
MANIGETTLNRIFTQSHPDPSFIWRVQICLTLSGVNFHFFELIKQILFHLAWFLLMIFYSISALTPTLKGVYKIIFGLSFEIVVFPKLSRVLENPIEIGFILRIEFIIMSILRHLVPNFHLSEVRE